MNTDILFQTWKLGSLDVKNRLSTLPMEGNDAEPDGRPSERTTRRYSRLAAGGWGIVYVEAISPDERGRARPGQLVLARNTLDSFKKLTEAIRSAASPPPIIIFQINHAGRYALSPLLPYHHEILDPTWNISKETPVASTGELEAAAESSAEAIRLSALAGADAADLKCCHGYLAVELLRPANSRQDPFGRGFDNRLRYMKTLIEAARDASAASPGFLFGARISLLEGFPGGLGSAPDGPLDFDPSDISHLIATLEKSGAAFVCGTLGIPYYNPELVRPWAKYEKKMEILFMHHSLCGWIKRNFSSISVISAGYTPLGKDFIPAAAANIANGLVDSIGLGRQSFADPEFPEKLRAAANNIKWCRCCRTHNCSFLLRNKRETGCVIYDPEYKKELKAALETTK